MNKCGHEDCFTCPYADCIVSSAHIKSVGLPAELLPTPTKTKKPKRRIPNESKSDMPLV